MKQALCACSFAENSGIISGGYSPCMHMTERHTHTQIQMNKKSASHKDHSTEGVHGDSLHFKLNVLSLTHMHTNFCSPLHSLETEYALCSCSLRERWGAGFLGLWETDMNKWTVLHSSKEEISQTPPA